MTPVKWLGICSVASAMLAGSSFLGYGPSAPAPAAAQPDGYASSFAADENPITEAGAWINGGTTGIDRGNVRTFPGLAFGANLPSLYGDPTAVLVGAWASDQEVQATVRANMVPKTPTHEVELRLRTIIRAHRITGYEINCSIDGTHPHIEIVRWNGALNDFTSLRITPVACVNRDLLEATVIGSVLTVRKNGVQVLRATDNTFVDGSPGIGFYDTPDNAWSNFGLSNFSARNIR
jgi:hypothetical protein